jgi:hypothetical protein
MRHAEAEDGAKKAEEKRGADSGAGHWQNPFRSWSDRMILDACDRALIVLAPRPQ